MLAIVSLYIVSCIVTNYLHENSKIIRDSYDTKVISISELEKIVKVKFTDDCIENPEIDLTIFGENGISMSDVDTYVDYYFYVVLVKTADQKYKILISGEYPYPIALN